MDPVADGSASTDGSVNSTSGTASKTATLEHPLLTGPWALSRSMAPNQATCHLPSPDCPFHRTTGPPHRSTTRSKHYPRRLRRLPQSSGQTAQSTEPLSPAFKGHSNYKYPHWGLRYRSLFAHLSSYRYSASLSPHLLTRSSECPSGRRRPAGSPFFVLQEPLSGGSGDLRRLRVGIPRLQNPQ